MAILYYSLPNFDFADLYLTVRKKENRFYSEKQVRILPNLEKDHPQYAEWQLRKKSSARFADYIKHKDTPLRILDIGCGNGWFSHLISTIGKTEVTGLDVNITELEQADKAFQRANLSFACANLYEKTRLNEQRFDIVVFNSCLQYFENLPRLLEIIRGLLSENGEIHLIDTPFYDEKGIESARQRTIDYYTGLGFPEMAQHYFHHCFEDLGNYKILYKPDGSLLKFLNKDSPFHWILIGNC